MEAQVHRRGIGGWRRVPHMDAATYADHLRRDGFALADAAEGHLETQVPGCPDWDVAELVWHTGEVHHFWQEVANRGLQDPREAAEARRPPGEELLEWFRKGVERLAETLQYADASRAVWTWAPQKDVAFIQRRMAQETAVHRWDAQRAAGDPQPIDADLAVDGVDEFLDLFLPAESASQRDDVPPVHLHSTDAPGEWVATISGGELRVEREHLKGAVAVRAPASDLLLLLWRRIDPASVEVLGDEQVLERLLERADLS